MADNHSPREYAFTITSKGYSDFKKSIEDALIWVDFNEEKIRNMVVDEQWNISEQVMFSRTE
jgi:hypothetical protein